MPLIRQPKRGYLRQLKIVISFLRGPLINHDTPHTLLAIRSNPVRPRLPARVGRAGTSNYTHRSHEGKQVRNCRWWMQISGDYFGNSEQEKRSSGNYTYVLFKLLVGNGCRLVKRSGSAGDFSQLAHWGRRRECWPGLREIAVGSGGVVRWVGADNYGTSGTC